MKTVTLKFVVEDIDEGAIESEVLHALEDTGLNSFSMYDFRIKDSTKIEKTWKRKQDQDREV